MIEIPGILDRICKEIRKTLKEMDENYNLIISGMPGKGKSGTALEIARRIDPNFTAEKVVFTPEGFMDILDSPLATPGSVIVFDEAGCGRSAYESQQKLQVAMNKVLQSHRYLNLCVIYTASFISFILKNDRKLAHANFKIVFKDKVKKRVIGKWYNLKYSDKKGENLTIFPKFTINSMPMKIKELAVPHPPMKLWRAYMKKEKPFKRSVRDDARKVIAISKDPDMLNREVKEKALNRIGKLLKQVETNPDKFKGKRGAYDIQKLAVGLKIGTKLAKKVKAAAELEEI